MEQVFEPGDRVMIVTASDVSGFVPSYLYPSDIAWRKDLIGYVGVVSRARSDGLLVEMTAISEDPRVGMWSITCPGWDLQLINRPDMEELLTSPFSWVREHGLQKLND